MCGRSAVRLARHNHALSINRRRRDADAKTGLLDHRGNQRTLADRELSLGNRVQQQRGLERGRMQAALTGLSLQLVRLCHRLQHRHLYALVAIASCHST